MSSVTGAGQRITVRVPAKINLELRVGPARDDGYHEIATVYQAVGLYDTVTVVPSPRWTVEVHGPQADLVPTDGSNLALAAARLLAESAGVEERVAISIDKQIPVAGGMAGGSADAAAALVACDALWGLNQGREDLEPLAARLGSDVPFLLHGGTAIGSGRGERVVPVLATGELHWVLWASERDGLSAGSVYAECDRLRASDADEAADTSELGEPEPSDALLSALRTMDTEAVATALHNDLQDAAVSLMPELTSVVEAGLELGAPGAMVSGSGPTVAFLVASPAQALDLAVGLAARGPAGQIHRAVGPVAGAQIIRNP